MALQMPLTCHRGPSEAACARGVRWGGSTDRSSSPLPACTKQNATERAGDGKDLVRALLGIARGAHRGRMDPSDPAKRGEELAWRSSGARQLSQRTRKDKQRFLIGVDEKTRCFIVFLHAQRLPNGRSPAYTSQGIAVDQRRGAQALTRPLRGTSRPFQWSDNRFDHHDALIVAEYSKIRWRT